MQNLKRLNSLLPATRRPFSTQNTLTHSMNPDRNHNLRVMSTPTWPVPYYQRAFRHPGNLDKRDGDLMHVGVHVHDGHVLMAKGALMMNGDGYVVEAIEQHYDLETYITEFQDSKQFCDAYVDDLLDCLGVAHQQNTYLLGQHDFSNCL